MAISQTGLWHFEFTVNQQVANVPEIVVVIALKQSQQFDCFRMRQVFSSQCGSQSTDEASSLQCGVYESAGNE